MFFEPEFWVAVAFVILMGLFAISASIAPCCRRSIAAASASRPNSTMRAASRKKPQNCSRNIRRVAPAPNARPRKSLPTREPKPSALPRSQGQDGGFRRAADQDRESKIALAEAQALADVRAAAADAAVAAASTILVAIGQGRGRRRAPGQGHRRSPRQAELTPVRRGFSNPSPTPVITGSPASAGDDNYLGATAPPSFVFAGFGLGSGFSACGSKPM